MINFNNFYNFYNLSKNKPFYLMNLMILISMMSFFLSNFIQMWMFMEINTILLILLMSIYNKNKKIIINYLIIQSISSLSLINLMIMNNNLNLNFLNFIILLFFILKLNLFPFFFWMPLINFNLNWIMIFFISTTQKIIPMLLMNLYFNQINNFFINYIYLTSILSSLTSLILSINELSMKKIITYSSMNHSSWMIFIIMIDKYLFIFYFFLYTISMIFICLLFNKFKINNFNNLNNLLLMNKKWMLTMISLNFILLSALPPFLTFLIKLKLLSSMINNFNNFFILTFLILSILTLIFYMNMLFKTYLIFKFKNKFWLSFYFKIKNTFFNLFFFMFLSISIFFLIEILI